MNSVGFNLLLLTMLNLAIGAPAAEIHEAALDGDVGKVSQLLQTTPQLVTARDPSFFDSTPLHLAAMNGHTKVVELLLTYGAEVDAADSGGWTPLIRAVANGNRDTAAVLLASNANVNAAMALGRTALHFAVMSDDQEMVDVLLAFKADVNANGGGEYDSPPLHEARSVAMVELLLAHHANIDAKDRSGETTLHKAALHNAMDIANALLLHKANVNVVDDDGKTPLHRAAWRHSTAVAKLLLENEADAAATDHDGNTARQIAVKRGYHDLVDLLQPHDTGGSKASGLPP